MGPNLEKAVPRRVGPRKDGAPEGWVGGPKFRAVFSLPPLFFLSSSLGFPFVEFWRSFKHHQISTKGPPREEERKKIVARDGKKKREILGGPAEEGVRRRGEGSGGRAVRGSAAALFVCVFSSFEVPSFSYPLSSSKFPKRQELNENLDHTQHRHTTPQHTPPHNTATQRNATQQQRHTTQHNGGSRTRRSWGGGSCRKVLGGAGPVGKGFLGSSWQRFGHKTA